MDSSYIKYINESLPDKPGDKIMYKFKRKILEEMTNRANEVTARGLKDRQVIDDLIISEYPDLNEKYDEFYIKETASDKRRKRILFNSIGSAIYLIVVVVVFLVAGFATKMWNPLWVVVVDGVLIWSAYLQSLGAAYFSKKKKLFHFIARVFQAGAIVTLGVAAFLLAYAMTQNAHSWTIVIFSLIASFLSDAIFCTVHKHKLAIFYWILYIPVISVFAFIILGATGIVVWQYAWMTIIVGLIIDIIVMLFAIANNRASDLEVDDTWNEN